MLRRSFDPSASSEKQTEWRWTSFADLCSFPDAARQVAGYQLGRLQQGEEPDDWKPMTVLGAGTIEVRVRVGTEHRILVVTKFDEALHVLHAFDKKADRTRRSDIELARRRYRDLLAERLKR